MKEFGKTAYEKRSILTLIITADERTFSLDMRIDRIIMGIELYVGHKISPHNTLLIFDEVQEVPKALSSLKYFNETAPEYQIVCAGSFRHSTPSGHIVSRGQVEFMDLYPLSFTEEPLTLGTSGSV